MYKDTLFYIQKHIKMHLIAVSVIFVLSIILGVLYASYFTVDATTIFEVLSQEFAQIGEVGPITTMLIIFFNNTIKTALVIIFGIFLGILPLLFIVTNGFIIGIISYFFHSSDQLFVFLIGILPHGIFEIPALLISSAIGLQIGIVATKWLFGKKGASVKKHFIRGVNVFTHAMVILFFMSACIEAFVTGFLLSVITF